MALVWLPPVAAVIAIAFSAWLARSVLAADIGTPAMQDVSGTILEGARAFLNRQYKTIATLALVVAVLVGGVLSIVNNDVSLGIHTFVAFLIGAACSGFAGFAGMSCLLYTSDAADE